MLTKIIRFMLRALLYTFLIALGATTCTFAQPEKVCRAPKPFQDWVFSDDCQYLCGGYYLPRLAPPYLDPEQINVEAGQSDLSLSGLSTFSGKVEISQGGRLITAAQTSLVRDKQTGEITSFQAKGNLILSEPDIRVEGAKGYFNTTTDYGRLCQAQFRFYPRHARGDAKQVEMLGKDCIRLREASYTTCGPEQNFWRIRAKRIDLNKASGRGEAYHAKFYIKDVPVMYFPYINFPIDKRRQSGFLYPTPGFDSRSGWMLEIPYYWNIAPNYDATLAYKHLARRGEQLRTKFRYLSLYHSGTVDFDYMPHDRAYKRLVRNNRLNDKHFSRYTLRLQEKFNQDPNWFGQIHLHQVSDDEYLMDFGRDLDATNKTQLLQSGTFGFGCEQLTVAARVEKYKTLHPFDGPITQNTYELMPQLHFNFHPICTQPFELHAFGQFTEFKHSATNQPIGKPVGNRTVFWPSIGLPMKGPGWFIKPKVNLYSLQYQLKQALPSTVPVSAQKRHLQLALPIFNVDSGLIFERKALCCNQTYWQTLEPKLYYLLVPYEDQSHLPNFDTEQQSFSYSQLYRTNRFSGFDRIGDANQATLGLEHRWFNCDTGEEKLLLGVGQIFYFRQKKVFLPEQTVDPHNRSPLAGYLQYQIAPCWRAYGATYWNTYQNEFFKNTVSAQYQPRRDTVLNLGYDFIRRETWEPDNTHQIHTSFAYQLDPTVRIMGKYHYDFKRGNTRTIMGGLEIEGCCGALRLMVSHFLKPTQDLTVQKYDTRFYIQLVFKGLGGVGTFDSAIKKAVPGYEWAERF